MNAIRTKALASTLALFTGAPAFLAQQVLAQQNLAQRLDHPTPAERRAAVLEVAALGDKARPFVPKLVERMADPDLDVAVAVLDACRQLGELVVAESTAAVAQREGQSLVVTAAVLGHTSHTAPPGRQALLATLVDTDLGNLDPRRRLLAAAAFGALTDCGVTQLEKLLKVLAETGSLAAPAASRTLTLHAERLHPVLRAMIQQKPTLVSPSLVAALPVRTQEHVETLAIVVRLTSTYARSDALHRLGSLGSRATEHLEVIAGALTAPTPGVRNAATLAFARVSRDEDRIAEVLTAALSDPDPIVVDGALDELRSQRLLQPPTIARLVTLLGAPTCREKAVELLGWSRRVQTDTLRPALAAADPATRIAAVQVLAKRGLATDLDLEPLPQWLREDSTRQPALRLVASLSGRQPKLLPMVTDLLRGADRALAIDAVATFGENAEGSTGRLLAALKDKDAAVRCAAAYALSNVAPGRREVVDALVRGVKDPHSGGWCLWAIRAMGKQAKAAAEGLRRLLGERDLPHRRDVLYALAAIGEVDATVALLLKSLGTEGNDDDRSIAVALLRDLFARDERERQAATKAKKLGSPWREVVKVLLDVARAARPQVRAEAYATLGAFCLDEAAQRCLREGLQEDGEVLAGVLRGFGHGLLPMTATEIERVGDLLVRGPEHLREVAATTLAQGGPAGHERLFSAMRDPQPATRAAAVFALQNLPWRTPANEAVLATLSTADGRMRSALVRYYQPFAKDATVVEQLLGCWDKAADDLSQRRTLAEIAVLLVGTDGCVARDRLLAKLRADRDPVVQAHAAQVEPH